MHEKTNKIAHVVSGGIGIFCGICVAKVSMDVLSNILPIPDGVLTKVAYGVGGYCLGDYLGNKVADSIENDLTSVMETIINMQEMQEGN